MSDLVLLVLGALALFAVQGIGIIIGVLVDAREGREAAMYWWFTTGWGLWIPAALVWGLCLRVAERRARRKAWQAMGPPVSPAQARAMHNQRGRDG